MACIEVVLCEKPFWHAVELSCAKGSRLWSLMIVLFDIRAGIYKHVVVCLIKAIQLAQNLHLADWSILYFNLKPWSRAPSQLASYAFQQ